MNEFNQTQTAYGNKKTNDKSEATENNSNNNTSTISLKNATQESSKLELTTQKITTDEATKNPLENNISAFLPVTSISNVIEINEKSSLTIPLSTEASKTNNKNNKWNIIQGWLLHI